MNQIAEPPKTAAAVHGSAIQAVAAAMADVKRVAKDNRNTEQKYDFASVDDFMEMVGPICAKHGLVTVIDEDQVDFLTKDGKYGPTQWAKITYQVTTHHTSGSWLPTVRRHVEVIRSGPQAYGSAQSYVLKQYYRGLLNIPTGEKDDPDFVAQQAHEQAMAPKSGHPNQQARDPSAKALSDAKAQLDAATSLQDLQQRWMNLPDQIKRDIGVIAAKDARKSALQQPADLGGDEIPY